MIDRTTIEGELTDAKAQRDSAQQQLNQAQAMSQQAAQAAQAAQAMIFTCNGSIQQNEAYLKKLDESEKRDEAPAPSLQPVRRTRKPRPG